MTDYINKKFWKETLAKPDWYIDLVSDFRRLEVLAEAEKDYTKRKAIKRDTYESIENALKTSQLPLAESGEDLDAERKPIDTIVIHHTNNRPGMTLYRLNAMQVLLLYGKYYKGQPGCHDPIWSGHFYKGQQVFWAYHWLVRKDGKIEHILDDEYIAWHAGNWDINTRSVAICIDDDLNDKEPGSAVIESIANIISNHYPFVKPKNIIGHCDVFDTKCPGALFNKSWRQKIIKQVESGGAHGNKH